MIQLRFPVQIKSQVKVEVVGRGSGQHCREELHSQAHSEHQAFHLGIVVKQAVDKWL